MTFSDLAFYCTLYGTILTNTSVLLLKVNKKRNFHFCQSERKCQVFEKLYLPTINHSQCSSSGYLCGPSVIVPCKSVNIERPSSEQEAWAVDGKAPSINNIKIHTWLGDENPSLIRSNLNRPLFHSSVHWKLSNFSLWDSGNIALQQQLLSVSSMLTILQFCGCFWCCANVAWENIDINLSPYWISWVTTKSSTYHERRPFSPLKRFILPYIRSPLVVEVLQFENFDSRRWHMVPSWWFVDFFSYEILSFLSHNLSEGDVDPFNLHT